MSWRPTVAVHAGPWQLTGEHGGGTGGASGRLERSRSSAPILRRFKKALLRIQGRRQIHPKKNFGEAMTWALEWLEELETDASEAWVANSCTQDFSQNDA